jgi:hypothetical protein
MVREGLYKLGNKGALHWAQNGKPDGNVGYQCYDQYLILDYRFRRNDDDWQPVKQTILIKRTPCNYGKSRLWFECPGCNYRCAILYGADVLFLCRKCYRLPYRSQMQSKLDTLFNQKHALGRRIFEDYKYGDGYKKKKGMHQSTFDRLFQKYDLLNSKVCRGTIEKLGKKL